MLALVLFAALLAAPPSAPPDASALSWMAGSWSGSRDGTDMEELWTTPAGGTLLGVHRDVRGGKTVSFEFLRIEATPAAVTYWASPQGRPATAFPMIESRERRVVFENPKHDFPTRVLYWREGDVLHARIEGVLDGKAAAEEWSWKRVP